jgi:hypothetical protein
VTRGSTVSGGTPGLAHARSVPAVGLVVSVALHALLLVLASHQLPARQAERPADGSKVIQLQWLPPATESVEPAPEPARPVPASKVLQAPPEATPQMPQMPQMPQPLRPPASMAAPPAPTAEEWAFAGRYALKNSKAYRYTWGQQVRSLMGTAIEGPDQGMVRFRVEIAPDGTVARLDTLWSTSPVAERLARQAVADMPHGPATPTGRPLVFERTISFTPFAADGPPLYRDDCLPDPPAFSNPFVWDGRSPQVRAEPKPAEQPDPQALADCLRQLPQDSIDAESAHDRRLMDQWGWRDGKLGR